MLSWNLLKTQRRKTQRRRTLRLKVGATITEIKILKGGEGIVGIEGIEGIEGKEAVVKQSDVEEDPDLNPGFDDSGQLLRIFSG